MTSQLDFFPFSPLPTSAALLRLDPPDSTWISFVDCVRIPLLSQGLAALHSVYFGDAG